MDYNFKKKQKNTTSNSKKMFPKKEKKYLKETIYRDGINNI